MSPEEFVEDFSGEKERLEGLERSIIERSLEGKGEVVPKGEGPHPYF